MTEPYTPMLGEQVTLKAQAFRDRSFRQRQGIVVGFGFATDTALVELPGETLHIKYDLLYPSIDVDADTEWRRYRRGLVKKIGVTGLSRRDFMAGWSAREAA